MKQNNMTNHGSVVEKLLIRAIRVSTGSKIAALCGTSTIADSGLLVVSYSPMVCTYLPPPTTARRAAFGFIVYYYCSVLIFLFFVQEGGKPDSNI
jgi:hypothetical protein